MFWSQMISLQMQPSRFNKRYYATQNTIYIEWEYGFIYRSNT